MRISLSRFTIRQKRGTGLQVAAGRGSKLRAVKEGCRSKEKDNLAIAPSTGLGLAARSAATKVCVNVLYFRRD